MFQGKTNAALRLLTDQGRGGVLHLDDRLDTSNGQRRVKDVLLDKHLSGQPLHPDVVCSEDPYETHPVLFESLDADAIRSAALHTSGAAGPSGLDALAWKRLCTSFKAASYELCLSLALTAKRLSTELVDPASITPLMACRLIALDKNPGVRPIGIGDTARRIIAKSILNITRQDIQDAAGSLQLCAGQISGTEAAVHAVRSLFQSNETEALLLVDASNAFNSLNRQTALHNIKSLCPSLATALINTYWAPSELYVDGDALLSCEGTTQGDPLAMPMYVLATIPLIRKLKESVNEVNQVWYADDASGAGKIINLRTWWDQLNILGPKFGYYTNPSKTWLVTKESTFNHAAAAFADAGVKVTSEGRPYLGVALGTDEYMQAFVSDKVKQWVSELEQLAKIACSQPHAAYAAFTHGMTSKWTYFTRTMPNIASNLLPLELTIRTKLIPALTGRPPPNDLERDLLSLPARFGGIALINPARITGTEFLSLLKLQRL